MDTPVIFRKFKNEEIIAIFPTIPFDNYGIYCQSYMHIGQHGKASYIHILGITKLAKENEYQELLQELKSIGYDDLRVCKRMSYKMYLQRKENLK